MTMILTCEECQTNYVVKADSIAPEGRTVKCIKCGHKWHQNQVEEVPEPVAKPSAAKPSAAKPTPGIIAKVPKDNSFPAATIQKKSTPLLLKLLPAVFLLPIIPVIAIFYKDMVVAKLPQAAKLYHMMGDISTDGVHIADSTIKKVKEDNFYDLYIKASVVNSLPGERALPPIKISLLDKDKKIIASNVMEDKNTILKPAEAFSLKTKIPRVSDKTAFVVLEIGNKWEFFVR